MRVNKSYSGLCFCENNDDVPLINCLEDYLPWRQFLKGNNVLRIL